MTINCKRKYIHYAKFRSRTTFFCISVVWDLGKPPDKSCCPLTSTEQNTMFIASSMFIKSHNYRIILIGRNIWRSPDLVLQCKEEQFMGSCSGSHPVKFWISAMMNDGDSTTLLYNSSNKSLSILTVIFLLPSIFSPCCHLHPLPLTFALCTSS